MVDFLCQQGADVTVTDNESHSLVHWVTGRCLGGRIAENEPKGALQSVGIFIYSIFSFDTVRRCTRLTVMEHFRFIMRHNYPGICMLKRQTSIRREVDGWVRKDLSNVVCLGLSILNTLMEHKADIDCVDGKQRTPFMWAASAGASDALRILYKYGANQLHVDKDSLSGTTTIGSAEHSLSFIAVS